MTTLTHGSSALAYPTVQESLRTYDTEFARVPETNEYCCDSASKSFGEISDMLTFLLEREGKAEWITGQENHALEVALLEDSDIPTTKPAISADTARGTKLVLTGSKQETTAIRDCAIPTLQDRAQISGSALKRVAPDVLRDIINDCLNVANKNSTCKIRIADDKVSAVMSSEYVPLPMPEIFQAATEYIQTRFPRNTFAAGYWNHSITTAEWELSGETSLVKSYTDALKRHGIDTEDAPVRPGLRLSSSDIGISGVNLVPKLVVGKDRLLLPLGKAVGLEHKGNASMSRFLENLDGVFAIYSECLKDLTALLDVHINYPAGCMEAVLKQLGIAQKYAKPVLEVFERAFDDDNTCTAHDIYYGLGELFMQAQIHGLTGEAALRFEESVAKALTLNFRHYDKPKKESR